jgi:3-isopropylmalate/(R)-2-methylmalate dehydratase small subunit
MLPKIKGKVAYVFDKPHFDADLIIGLDNCTVTNPVELKKICMKDIDPDFQNYVENGDVVVCAEDFGYGHPHIGGPIALQAHGISAFIAESFCPGFYRANSLRGVPLIECDNLVNAVKE